MEKQKRLKEIAAISSQYSGDLTMERFVEVSDSFKDAFGKKSDEEENQTFSLLKAFGRQGPDEEEEEEKEGKMLHTIDYLTNSPVIEPLPCKTFTMQNLF